MRILFVAAYSSIEPLGLLHLAGLARDMGWERKIHLVGDHDFTGLYEIIDDFKPDFVGFNIYTGNHLQTFAAIDFIKSYFTPKVIVGGPHPTYFPMTAAKHADYVVMSEGFHSLQLILSGVAGEGVLPFNKTIRFPMPDRETLYKDYPEFAASPIKSIIGMTGCPYRCTYCFHPQSSVNTPDGLKLISEIVQNGKSIDVYDGYGGIRKATQFYQRKYRGQLIQLNLWKRNFPLLLTPNHEIYTERGLVRSDQILKDDWVRISIPNIGYSEPSIDPRLAGFYISEGSVSFSGRGSQLRFSFNSNEFNYHDEVCNLLIDRYSGAVPRRVVQGSTTHIELTRNYISNDMFNMFGSGAVGKNIPVEVFGWPSHAKLDFLNAWLDGDGYRKQGRIITVSPTLAMQGYLLALSIGMRPSIWVRDIPDSEINGRVIHTENRMWTLAFNHRDDREKLNCPPEDSQGIMPSNKDRFIRFVDGAVFIRVKSISTIDYEGDVYNIGVDDEHSYSVNGVSVSNCYNSSSVDDIVVPPDLAQEIGENLGMSGRLFPFNIRSVDDIINEGMELISKWPETKIVYFQDDVHGFDVKGWLPELASEWSDRLHLPYHAQMRWEMVAGDGGARRLDLVRMAGCTGLTLAVEAANTIIRKEVLDRATPDSTMFDGMRQVKERGLKVRTEQITALPYGATRVPTPVNLHADLEIVRLNTMLKPDMAWASTFAPYAGTKLGKYADKHGFYNEPTNYDVPDSFFDRSILRFPNGWVGPSLSRDSHGAWLNDDDLNVYRDQNAALRRHFNLLCLLPDGYEVARKFLCETDLSTDALCKIIGGDYFDHLPKGELARKRYKDYQEGGRKDVLSTAVRHHLYEEILYK